MFNCYILTYFNGMSILYTVNLKIKYPFIVLPGEQNTYASSDQQLANMIWLDLLWTVDHIHYLLNNKNINTSNGSFININGVCLYHEGKYEILQLLKPWNHIK